MGMNLVFSDLKVKLAEERRKVHRMRMAYEVETAINNSKDLNTIPNLTGRDFYERLGLVKLQATFSNRGNTK